MLIYMWCELKFSFLGFWMLRDEQSRGWTRGMDIIFQVGDLGDVVATPTNFPTCGSFIGPDFFLL